MTERRGFLGYIVAFFLGCFCERAATKARQQSAEPQPNVREIEAVTDLRWNPETMELTFDTIRLTVDESAIPASVLTFVDLQKTVDRVASDIGIGIDRQITKIQEAQFANGALPRILTTAKVASA